MSHLNRSIQEETMTTTVQGQFNQATLPSCSKSSFEELELIYVQIAFTWSFQSVHVNLLFL